MLLELPETCMLVMFTVKGTTELEGSGKIHDEGSYRSGALRRLEIPETLGVQRSVPIEQCSLL